MTEHPRAGRLLSARLINAFQKRINEFYKKNGRHDLPWRLTRDPYHILVSEYMLQQTQVNRVLKKYDLFLQRFPDPGSLARAPLQPVLSAWQGLGYNRRAIALRQAAGVIIQEHKGKVPQSLERLCRLPGIGMATGSAVMTFAFNKPIVFVETNIRRVYIHVFFNDKENVSDGQLLPLIRETLDILNPRHWYYALMDYGAFLRTQGNNPNRRSAHYSTQTQFEGSNRQLRGRILKVLLDNKGLSPDMIAKKLRTNPKRTQACLKGLQQEGFVKESSTGYTIA
jgi:A/G-specific adenine glycosylase